MLSGQPYTINEGNERHFFQKMCNFSQIRFGKPNTEKKRTVVPVDLSSTHKKVQLIADLSETMPVVIVRGVDEHKDEINELVPGMIKP